MQHHSQVKRIIFTSDGKRKHSVNLRQLLADTPQSMFSTNLIPMQSQRLMSSQRPMTMYNDRIMKQLYPQSSLKQKRGIQIKLMSSQPRLTRNKSEYLKGHYQNYSKQKQKQKISLLKQPFVIKQQKIKMKKILGKINLLASDSLKLQSQQQLQTIFNFLQCISKNQNHYQQGFRYLTKKLQQTIFLQKDNLDIDCYNNLRNLAELSKNRAIIEAIYKRTDDKVTYKDLMSEIVKQILKIQSNTKVQTMKSSNQLQQIKQILSQKQQLIIKLCRKLKHFQEHPSQNHYPQLQQLKNSNKLLRKQVQQLLYQNNILNHNLQIFNQVRLNYQNKIQDLKKKIIQYELQKQSNLDKVQKSSQLKQFQSNVTMLKEMLDRSILKMSGMKQQYDKLKQYNQVLLSERTKLSKRAAVGFGQLTPRPNLKRIFQQNQLDYQTVFQNIQTNINKPKVSTQNFVEILISKFKNYYDTYKIYQKSSKLSNQKDQSNIKKKKNIIKKQKDVFDIAMDDVYETKNQIKKTIKAADQVKIAYQKQQEELLKK